MQAFYVILGGSAHEFVVVWTTCLPRLGENITAHIPCRFGHFPLMASANGREQLRNIWTIIGLVLATHSRLAGLPVASHARRKRPTMSPVSRVWKLKRSRKTPLLVGLGLLAGLGGSLAHANAVQRVLPQGSVSQVRQVQVDFAQAVVALGQPDAPAPVQWQCEGADARQMQGQGRWLNAQRWVFEFAEPLPSGVRCAVSANPSFRGLNQQGISALGTHRFDTGGPRPLTVLPYPWNDIDEQQHFLIQTSGVATPQSLLANVWCEAADVGERIPVRLLSDVELQAALQATDNQEQAQQAPEQWRGLACQRRLSPGVDVQLVWGAGVASPAGVVSQQAERHDYTVREPFTAEFTCQREQASQKCIPLLPLRLNFNAEFDRQWVEQFRLVSGGRSWPATVEGDEASGEGTPPPTTPVDRLVFQGPFPANTAFTLEVPAGLQDDASRPLRNAAAFPLQVATGDIPPLAKFASGDFAIIERFAEGRDAPALLPVTLRKVESELPLKVLRLQDDRSILDWMRRMEQFSPGNHVAREQAEQAGLGALPPRASASEDDDGWLPARTLSLLNAQAQARALRIPAPASNPQRQEAEVVGIPLEPGYQIVEIASPLLGKALLDATEGTPPVLYARTAVLVTNLSVHFKLGQENALAWVTSLDDGRPVKNATVRVNHCDGSVLAEGKTDSQGRALFPQIRGTAPECEYADGGYRNAYFITARSADEKDLGLVWSDWQNGIEPWRFNVPTQYGYHEGEDLTAHSVTDRSLLRAGETISMKHYLRRPTLQGFATPEQPPAEMIVTHQGSGQEFTQPLQWYQTADGGLNAHSSLKLPALAPLGHYSIRLHGDGVNHYSGSFRVEEFRLPVFRGSLVPVGNAPLVHASAVDMNVQLQYVAGGAAAHWPAQASALLEPHDIRFAQYTDYRFTSPLTPAERRARESGRSIETTRQLVLDKQALTLDAQGNARIALAGLPTPAGLPQSLRTEITYADPSGETHTLSQQQTIWPASVLVGLKTESWVSEREPVKLHAIVLTPDGKPAAGIPVQVIAQSHTTLSTRKRLVGGFYQYDHQYQSRALGTVCEGKSDRSGRVECSITLQQSGEVELIATVQDDQQRRHSATTSIWVSRAGQWWFDGEASDRMDVLPEKPAYEPGETARFQVRMPFRKAQALVAIEREGVLESQVIELSGDNPSFSLKVGSNWGPNTYISVLAVRGRLRDVPWQSFFSWGFKTPVVWWRAWRDDQGEAAPATALVDLSKPAYRLGVAAIQVGHAAHRLNVSVQADKPRYATRDTATLQIEAKLPNGKPAAHAEIALAVVDKALLELAPNTSWELLQAMMQTRPWGVATATAQMEVLGRRHYGRKAAPAGGGGGADGATRELFDTLLLWQPRITLDAQGKAKVSVPLNDSITTFHAQAIADAGTSQFGSGSTELQVAQDLQIISGLPPVVREKDHFDAQFTLRNSTNKAQRTTVTARINGPAGTQTLPDQTVDVPAAAAQTVQWRVQAPLLGEQLLQDHWEWQLDARVEGSNTIRDSLRSTQTLLPAVPVTVRQASLHQLSASQPLQLQASLPAQALEGRGSLRIEAQASLAAPLPGVLDWWQRYPYACLEQRYGKSIGLRDAALWASVAEDLPAYLDSDGLASYFPPQQHNDGSPLLTAHLLAVDATLQALGETGHFRLPDATRQQMIQGLTGFVEGRTERTASPLRSIGSGSQQAAIYRLSAIAALAQHGAATPAMLESIAINPRAWPTHALIDWLQILHHLPQIPQQAQHLQQVQNELRSRLLQTGVQTQFSTETSDHWWWAMQNGDVNAARLLLLTSALPAWKDDMGALATGLLARQSHGAWSTTVANLWGPLALQRFAQLHESTPVDGRLQGQLGAQTHSRDWPALPSGSTGNTGSTAASPLRIDFDWPDAIARKGNPASSQLRVQQQGSGSPWVTISTLAAVPSQQPVASGLQVARTITPVVQRQPGQWSRGDIYRVHLRITASAATGISAITDPVPAGSTILGSSLGRDSSLATADETESDSYHLAWVERKMDAMRVYYHALPQGTTEYEYTVRLNQPGEFFLPPTRAEALYSPQVFGEVPNNPMRIQGTP